MKCLASFILCFLCLPSFCQELPSGKPEKIDTTLYTLKQRQGLYPFKQAAEIRIVSFDKQDPFADTPDTRVRYKNIKYGLPITNDTICLSKLAQTVTLTAKQIDTIGDILYNTCARWTIRQSARAGCYLPHNAILFLDKDGKVFDYIEICFDCSRIVYSNQQIERFDDCDLVYTDLRIYFKQLGLKTSKPHFDKKDTPNKTN